MNRFLKMTLLPCTTCQGCPEGARRETKRFRIDRGTYVIALAGNPNVGKSTIFNELTGLRQHTGNWPGKTVARHEGRFTYENTRFRMIDLPGTYSLSATTPDEEVARDYLLSGEADVTVVVVDAGCLERNLNLVLQILHGIPRVVVCLNLVDEARRHGIEVDTQRLSEKLGVPVVATSARFGQGIEALRATIHRMVGGVLPSRACHSRGSMPTVEHKALFPESSSEAATERFYWDAGQIAQLCARRKTDQRPVLDRRLDRILTNRWTGFPVMVGLLAVVLWLTVVGANYPSAFLSWLLIETIHPALRAAALGLGLPVGLVGVSIDGVYLATAWVISVMLPPMAIFFPLFTLLEDFGYLPRVAFNLDGFFRRVGAHGKQALTMSMGFGCNAAGVVSTRVIDSPRERLLAIVTNNFSLCNGRWPTQILIATIFLGSLVPSYWAGLISTASVVGVALLGVVLTFVVTWFLSQSLLRGEASTFSLELPPYRPPRLLHTLYTSLIDRTLLVLWRAIVFAAPAGAVIWLIANVEIGSSTLADWFVRNADPMAVPIGLNGVVLLAYLVAIPANEIVIPTILMLTVVTTGLTGVGAEAGVMFETSDSAMGEILRTGGWTTLTAVNLMLFSLIHNPCSTAIYTIYKETRSVRWTLLATLLPVVLGVAVCFVVAQLWRLLG